MTDPLNSLHSDVFDLIFQHFSWSELAASSEVCSSWYKTIAESRVCMNKVEVKISNSSRRSNSDRSSLQTLQIDRKSQRHYKNIIVDFADRSRFKLLTILKPACRKWRSVHLLNGNFNNGKFALNFHETVENLTLTRVQCENGTDGFNFTFPRLKNLKLTSCDGNTLKMFKNCTGLRSLQLSKSGTTCGVDFTELLVNNKDLEELSMCMCDFASIISKEIIDKVKFKLNKIVIDSFDDCFTPQDKESIKLLLQSQASLKIVHIYPWCGTDIMETCWAMKQLRDLSLDVHHRSDAIDWTRLALPINSSIHRIHLSDVSKHEDASLYEAIFKGAPNLRVYKSKYMHFDDLLALSSRCKNMCELYIEEFDISFLPLNPLPNVTKFKSCDVNEDLIKILQTKGSRNSFEEKILYNG